MSKNKKWKSGASHGAAFEEESFIMFDNAGIPYRKEETLSSSKRRKKDKKCDIECFINDKSIFIELKTMWDDNPLKFDVFNKITHEVNLKYHQIKSMDYLVIKWRPHTKIEEPKMYMIKKFDFVMWASSVKKASMNLKDCRKIGIRIYDMEWLKEVL